MELQGRDLRANMRGPDVKLLQKELGKLGYDIPRVNGFRHLLFLDTTLIH